MTPDISRDRFEMEKLLDYELRASLFYPLFPLLEFCGFLPMVGWWFGKKTSIKYRRTLNRSSEMDAIAEERGPYEGFWR